MKVLVFEDTDDKFVSLANGLQQVGVDAHSIKRAKSLGEGLRELTQNFDLFIIDLWLPLVSGGDAVDVTSEVVALIEQQSKIKVPIIAITSFAAEAARHEHFLASRGVHIYDFYAQEIWKKAMSVYAQQANDRHRYDFIIFTALDEERKAYSAIDGFSAKSVTRANLDFWDFEWANRKGAIVLYPRMGLVTASVATARVLENYSPKIVCMSGICGGIGKETHLGQLLITDLCWEYQSGKWTDDMFSAEPYQVEVDDDLKLKIAKKIENEKVAREYEQGFDHGERPSKTFKPKLAIFATGSAVIASEERLKHVREQQRKVSGIDMEIYGFHRAVKMCNRSIISFSAKTVVDKADVQKNDNLHQYGCYVSAKFCLSLIEDIVGSVG